MRKNFKVTASKSLVGRVWVWYNLLCCPRVFVLLGRTTGSAAATPDNKKLVSNRNPVKEKENAGHRPLQSYSLTGFFAFLEG
jgi:hypothetical protein